MSIVSGVRKHARTVAKVSLYAAGAYAIGRPLVSAGAKLASGSTVTQAADKGLFEATGYDAEVGRLISSKTQSVIFRDVVGIAAIYTASKL